jgi:hypothetical protein
MNNKDNPRRRQQVRADANTSTSTVRQEMISLHGVYAIRCQNGSSVPSAVNGPLDPLSRVPPERLSQTVLEYCEHGPFPFLCRLLGLCPRLEPRLQEGEAGSRAGQGGQRSGVEQAQPAEAVHHGTEACTRSHAGVRVQSCK